VPSNIEYRTSFVAFLDVLGFKKMVLSSSVEKLNEYFDILDNEISRLKAIEQKLEIGYLSISDSVILTMPLTEPLSSTLIDEVNLSRLRELCVAVGTIQQKLALRNIWLRGAISVGNTYFDQTKNQIVGPAYVDAYMLEENVATFPRVILDPKIISVLKVSDAATLIEKINGAVSGPPAEIWPANILFSWILKNGMIPVGFEHDVALFIDYLSPLIESREEEMNTVLDNIQKSIYEDSTVFKKHRWTLDYIRVLATFPFRNKVMTRVKSM